MEISENLKEIKKINTLEEYKKLISIINNKDVMYLFRGQKSEKWALNSSWIRQETNDFKNKEEIEEILRNNIVIFNSYLNDKNTYLEDLAKLQHSKDVNTPLIDFTDDIMIATWFALSSVKIQKNKENAAIFILEVDKNNIHKKIKNFNEMNLIYQSPNNYKRSIAQRSYFLLDNQNWEKNEMISKITISKDAIIEIFNYLVKKNKTHISVYPDLKGSFLDNVDNSWNTYFLEALKTEDPEKQIFLYNKAIELNPNDGNAYLNRGNTYNNLKKYDKAIEDYSKVIELNHNDGNAYFNRGNTYNNLKKYDKAIEDYSKVIELNPNDWKAYSNRGNTYIDLKKYDKAMEDYGKVIELNPNDGKAFFNRGNAYNNLKKYDKAIEDFSKAIKFNSNDGEAYLSRGIAYGSLEKYDKAIEDCKKFIELDNNVNSKLTKDVQTLINELESFSKK